MSAAVRKLTERKPLDLEHASLRLDRSRAAAWVLHQLKYGELSFLEGTGKQSAQYAAEISIGAEGTTRGMTLDDMRGWIEHICLKALIESLGDVHDALAGEPTGKGA